MRPRPGIGSHCADAAHPHSERQSQPQRTAAQRRIKGGKLRHREVRCLAQSCASGQWLSWEQKPGPVTPDPLKADLITDLNQRLIYKQAWDPQA